MKRQIALIAIQYPPTIGGLPKYLKGIVQSAPPDIEISVISTESDPEINITGLRQPEAVYLKVYGRYKGYPLINPVALVGELRRKSWERIVVVYPFPGMLEVAAFFAFLTKTPVDCIYVDDIVLKGIPGCLAGIYEHFFALITRHLFCRISAMSTAYARGSRGLKGMCDPVIEISPVLTFPQKTVAATINKEAARIKIGYPDASAIFLFVGGLRRRLRYKRLDIILQAWVLSRVKSNDHFLIVGGGALLEYYKKLAEGRGAHNVHFLGSVRDDELMALYQAADVFLIASEDNNEAFGLVCIEAMSFGCRVVATDIPGFRGAIGKEKLPGVFFANPGNVNSFVDGINLFIDNPDPGAESQNSEYAGKYFLKDSLAGPLRRFFASSSGKP